MTAPREAHQPERRYQVDDRMGVPTLRLMLTISCPWLLLHRTRELGVTLRDINAPVKAGDYREVVSLQSGVREVDSPWETGTADRLRALFATTVMTLARDFCERITDDDLIALKWLPPKTDPADEAIARLDVGQMRALIDLLLSTKVRGHEDD